MTPLEYALRHFASTFYGRAHVVLLDCLLIHGGGQSTETYAYAAREIDLIRISQLRICTVRRALGRLAADGLLFSIAAEDAPGRLWAIEPEVTARALYERTAAFFAAPAARTCTCGIPVTGFDAGDECPVCGYEYDGSTAERRACSFSMTEEHALFDAASAARYGGRVPLLPPPPSRPPPPPAPPSAPAPPVEGSEGGEDSFQEEDGEEGAEEGGGDDDVFVRSQGVAVSIYELTDAQLQAMTADEFDAYHAVAAQLE